MDTVSRKTRSWIMSRIRGRDTRPELAFSAFLSKTGVAFECHPAMAEHPDFVLGGTVTVFVNGCFWHGCPEHYKEPKSNVGFWRKKIRRNKERQEHAIETLLRIGFDVLVLWEHSIKDGSYKKDVLLAVRKRRRRIRKGKGRLLNGRFF